MNQLALTLADDPCCAKPDIVNMDFSKDGESYTNRVCLHCRVTWYGREGDVTRYTRKEWDAWLEEEDA